MKNIKIFIVDAFASELFKGNPAAVCPLDNWLPDDLMQNIAFENNLSETAFIVKKEKGFHIRWFTPKAEVKLCGHATLATSHVLFRHLGYEKDEITFYSKSGELKVKTDKEKIILNFPTNKPEPIEISPKILSAFDFEPVETLFGGTDYLIIANSEEIVRKMKPDLSKLSNPEIRGVIVSAKGETCDFVSRFFAPGVGIDEDPVTGSAHTVLIPYWAQRLDKNEMFAQQLSERGGELQCKHLNNRVEIGGEAVTYMTGNINIG